MTFGTFDGLHPGHLFLLTKARELGDELTVALALDKTVKQLKDKPTKFNFRERQMALEDSKLVDLVIPADKKLGSYKTVKKIKPDIITLGYDQVELKNDLEAWIQLNDEPIQLITLPALEPNKYKSSILN